jgi:hypothetical protein
MDATGVEPSRQILAGEAHAELEADWLVNRNGQRRVEHRQRLMLDNRAGARSAVWTVDGREQPSDEQARLWRTMTVGLIDTAWEISHLESQLQDERKEIRVRCPLASHVVDGRLVPPSRVCEAAAQIDRDSTSLRRDSGRLGQAETKKRSEELNRRRLELDALAETPSDHDLARIEQGIAALGAEWHLAALEAREAGQWRNFVRLAPQPQPPAR